MRICAAVIIVILAAAQVHASENRWYKGDERCPPPKEDSTYSAPYSAQDHPGEFPTFSDADKPGWSCSYQREDGVIVQFGDSRTPKQQWMDVWAGNDNN
jgi:hypothetical protein